MSMETTPLTVGEFTRAQGVQTGIILRGFADTNQRLSRLEGEYRTHGEKITVVETLLAERTEKHRITKRNMFTGWASAAGLLMAEVVKALWQMKHP